MSYILGAQRCEDPKGSYERYCAYIKAERHRFPPSALALVESDWYFNFKDHRALHDSWLEDVQVSEVRRYEDEDSRPVTTIHVRLLGACHDGMIELTYSGVTSYRIEMADLSCGHCDWRYDEFRLSESGGLIHEIEWCGAKDTGRWLIQARDVTYSWHPFDCEESPTEAQTRT